MSTIFPLSVLEPFKNQFDGGCCNVLSDAYKQKIAFQLQDEPSGIKACEKVWNELLMKIILKPRESTKVSKRDAKGFMIFGILKTGQAWRACK